LAWSVILLYINDSKKINNALKIIINIFIFVITFPADWSCIAVLAVSYLNHYRGNFKKQMISMSVCTFLYALVYFIFLDRVYGLLQLFTCLTIPLLRLYNGERGKIKSSKWFFYIYYPAHLAVIGIIRISLYGNMPLIF